MVFFFNFAVIAVREDLVLKNLLSCGHCPKVPQPPPTHQVMNILDHFNRNRPINFICTKIMGKTGEVETDPVAQCRY